MDDLETIEINNNIEECLQEAIQVSLRFEQLTGKQLNITPTIGEFYACKKYNLKWVLNDINMGYDAIDINNKKVQIKTRRYKGKPASLTGPLLNKKFEVTYDYALLVLLDSEYCLLKIIKVEAQEILYHFQRINKEREEQRKEKRKTMSVSQFENLSKNKILSK
jgi:hypothetical protein